MTVNAPAARRYAGIKALSSALLDHQEEGKLTTDDREAIAADVRQLAKLGRSARWLDAVEGWARLIESEEHSLYWAVVQGSIWTAREAE